MVQRTKDVDRDSLLMAQAMADEVGATKRQIQLWTDGGALHCLPETDHQGTGRQRLYPRSELPVAAVVAFLARYKMPIGDLKHWSGSIRQLLTYTQLMKRSAHQKWCKAALRGDFESYLVLDPFKTLGVSGFTREGLPPQDSHIWLHEDKLLATLREYPGAIVVNVRKMIARFME